MSTNTVILSKAKNLGGGGATTIGFIPLDDRPVSFSQPLALAQECGHTILHPPVEWLGHRFTPGQPERIGQWLIEHADQVDGWVIALDMLAYGGLVASREPAEPLATLTNRLAVVKQAKTHAKSIPFYAFQSIRRLSITVKSEKDIPEWERASAEPVKETAVTSRLINHQLNRSAIDMVKDGVIDFLSLLQEDARPGGVQEPEQVALLQEISHHTLQDKANLTTGCDEGAFVLMARLILQKQNRRPQVRVVYASEKGARAIALYEDRTIAQSVAGQVRALGGVLCESAKEADIALLVWCPDRPCRDLVFEAPGAVAPADVADFILQIRSALGHSCAVALADVADANGADPQLASALIRDTDFLRLAGYAAWNTASNTIGCALAQAALNPESRSTLLLRFIEDWGYQTEVRPLLIRYIKETLTGDIWALSEEEPQKAERFLNARMNEWLRGRPNAFQEYAKNIQYELPWGRAFEMAQALRC